MAFPHRQHNATVLPDGTVPVTGGTRGPAFNDLSAGAPVHQAELWDPEPTDPAAAGARWPQSGGTAATHGAPEPPTTAECEAYRRLTELAPGIPVRVAGPLVMIAGRYVLHVRTAHA